MFHIDWDYQWMIHQIMTDGEVVQGRNSEVKKLRNLSLEITSTPLISIRRTAWKNCLREMEWFLSGSNNINNLHGSVRHWWKPWADERGFVPNNYAVQLRNFHGKFNSVDQVQYLIESVKDEPTSRRNVITTWNTADMLNPNTLITNCHGSLIVADVDNDNKLHLTMIQRSADMMLGVPHNMLQYWAFLMYLAHQTGREVGSLHWQGVNCHIYKAHYDAANEISDKIKNTDKKIITPNLIYTPTSDEFKADDFSLDKEYEPVIKSSLELIV